MFVVENISFGFAKDHVLFANVSFVIKQGEIIHLKGANGAGKTSLIRSLLALEHASIKHCSLYGNHELQFLRKNCSYLPSDQSSLYSFYNAIDNIKFFTNIENYRLNRFNSDKLKINTGFLSTNIDKILNKWGFCSYFLKNNLKVKFFSSGMKKRLALAKIECLNKDLWLLDEPTICLDKLGRDLLIDLIKSKQARKGMILIASHDQSFLNCFDLKSVDITL